MGDARMIKLCLSAQADVPSLCKQKRLLDARNLSPELHLRHDSTQDELLLALDRLVQSARILLLDESEIYFVEDEDIGPFTPRNEIESLNSVLSAIDLSLDGSKGGLAGLLQFLRKATCDLLGKIEAQCDDYKISGEPNSNAEEMLLKWGKELGVKSKLRICHFEGTGRGAVASQYLEVGSTALEIPSSLIINEDLVYESEMFAILENLGGISPETMALLWSMKARHDQNSKFRAYFDALPTEFRTGLSFGVHALSALEGTALFEELIQAKEHLRHQYDALCPTLCANHPKIFPPDLYTWDQFIWACELWYSNGMKIIFPDGNPRTCLVPIAGFLNHSLCPHVTRYGKIDPASNSLRLILARPCHEGEQCFLSYGSFPSSHLITFYGFLPRDLRQNPYDVIPLDFEDSEEDECWSTHMVRGTWLSKRKGPPNFGIPPPLVDRLRSALRPGVDGDDAESGVWEAVQSIFGSMMDQIGAEDLARDDATWDVRLALDFVDSQRRIISSVVDSSVVALESLARP
ncbi:SET domain-containing protein isoform X2 [Wolffia australiana]